jgi:transposase InsO family protein
VADAPSIEEMCSWVGVSKSGYFEWKDRPPSATARRRATLMAKIRAIFTARDETYGYRRVHAELARAGVVASLELVRRLMRLLGLVPCQVRRPRSLTV